MKSGLGFDYSEDHVCDVCSCDFTSDEGGVSGYFGILPVEFCPNCFSCMCDMVEEMCVYGEEEEEEEEEAE